MADAGWGWPTQSRKAHYFVSGRSLCSKWLFWGAVEEGTQIGPDDCRECAKKWEARRAAVPAPPPGGEERGP